MAWVLGLDIGTTSTVGILVRSSGPMAGPASRPVQLNSPHAGWAEEDPGEWWANVRAICRELIASAQVDPTDIAAIGVTGMLPALVLLDSRGALLRPSIQQSDGRCGLEVAELRAQNDEAAFLRRAGNGINQQLAAPRLRWLARHEPDVFARIATVFGSYDFINWKLTGRRGIERNWALEAGLVDVTADALDPGLIALAGVPGSAVPPMVASHAIAGAVTDAAAAATGLAVGTPVIGGAADMIASALGAGVVEPGDVLIKLGGAVDILTVTDRLQPDARLFLDYHLVPGRFVPNGCMSTGGSVLNWFVRTLGAGEAAAARAIGQSPHARLDALAAACSAGSDGLTVLPYFLGEKTPLHDPGARGVFEGLTLSHGLGHLWRALLEGYGYAIRHHVEVIREIGHPTTRFLASDGGAASDVWLQIIADILQAPIVRLEGHPGSSLGVAWAAAMAVGLGGGWSDVGRFTRLREPVRPDPAVSGLYDRGYERFRALHGRLYL